MNVVTKKIALQFVVGLTALLISTVVVAQTPPVQVMQLNQQALTAYGNLDIAEALELLKQAEGLCAQNNLTGNPLARTYLNLGMVEYGGNGDSGAALEYFRKAMCLDNTVKLDPLNSTPEMEALLVLAKNQATSLEACADTRPTPVSPTTPDTPTQTQPAAPVMNNVIRHTPVTQQKELFPIPLYAQTNPDEDVKSVILYYRTVGERIFQQLPMKPYEGGWAATIDCDVLTTFEPTGIDYYIAVLDSATQLLATAGTEAQPFQVSIVQVLTDAFPVLPNASPPTQCQRTCPPWNPDCNKGGSGACKDYGDFCSADSDCCDDMVCASGTCEPGKAGRKRGGGGSDEEFEHKVRIMLSAGTGLGVVSSGTYDANDFPNMYSGFKVGNDAGMALNKLHFRAGVMVALPVEKLEVGVTFRGDLPLAPGYSALAPSVIANASYRILGSNAIKGVQLLGVFGLGWMNVMHRITFDDCAMQDINESDLTYTCSPLDWYEQDSSYAVTRNGFRKSGFLGVELGVDANFWLTKNFGLNLGVMFDVLFPTFAFNMDFQGGVALRF